MPKPSAEQNTLFSSASTAAKDSAPEILSVSGLTKNIRDTLETSFTDVTVEGEISNYTHHRSGHRYWTLKDENAQISCVFWKTRSLSFEVEAGQRVVCRGRISVYPPRGSYQLDVFQVRPVGIGALQLAFEKLFKKLQAEGLFDERRKRPLPKFPERIGIVTSQTGAAVHDILTVLRRRYPLVDVLLRPASVQGVGSELEVARAIQDFNRLPLDERPDLLIVGRGGGSLEDLWTFNEEAVARAIYTSAIPIVSAVGHEVDVTIADFVADLRAPTPTAAAELVTPDKNELLRSLSDSASTIRSTTIERLSDLRATLQSHSSGYGLKYVLAQSLRSRTDQVVRYLGILNDRASRRLEFAKLKIEHYETTLRVLNPHSILSRGYAIVRNDRGEVVTSPEDLPVLTEGSVQLGSGSITVRRTS